MGGALLASAHTRSWRVATRIAFRNGRGERGAHVGDRACMPASRLPRNEGTGTRRGRAKGPLAVRKRGFGEWKLQRSVLGGRALPLTMRFGTVSIVGRTNVGKSTFLNAVLGEDLAIVSPLPQTTRDTLLGVVTREDAQIAFVDTPGLHEPKSELGRRMNLQALDALRGTDAVLFMTDTDVLLRGSGTKPPEIAAEDRDIVARLPKETPVVLVVNKVDRVKNKPLLLPLLEAWSKLHDFRAIVPTSVLRDDGVDRVLDELVALLPESEPAYAADTLTDRPMQFFVREYVREQILNATRGEVPHAVAVTVDRYEEGRIPRIAATIHVEKPGQRKILVGEGGAMLRRIGTAARKRIEHLVGKHVYLELF